MPRPATKTADNKRNGVQRKPRMSPNGYQLPDPIQPDEILTDVLKKKWKLGKSVGVGGFGEIYMASDDIQNPAGPDCRYVVKVEPHNNGPLFSEMHFYHRVAKSELIENWMRDKKLRIFGMPKFIGSGSHDYRGTKYRFMVMERFGDDLQKVIEANGKKFKLKTVLTLGIKILDILEYIHSHGYIHADIKGSNLLLGYNDRSNEKVYLVDFGLACRYAYSDGKHKEYNEDPRKAHDGTIEYTSRDAHVGAHSRRGDLEILGYNMVHWLCGKLPWEDNLKNPETVHAAKSKYMDNIPKFMKDCFPKPGQYSSLQQYLDYIVKLRFDEEPNYDCCRRLLREGLRHANLKDDGKLEFGDAKVAQKAKKRKSETEDNENAPKEKLQKRPRSSTRVREPCAPAPINRIKKTPLRARTKPVKKTSEVSSPPLDIPTPAMLLVLKKKEEKLQNRCSTPRNKKNIKSSPVLLSTPEIGLHRIRRKTPNSARSSSQSSAGSPELFADSF